MAFDPRRLRAGEWLAGAAALATLVILFAVDWASGRTGWNAAAVTRFPVLLAGLTGLALALAQGARRSPALPACLSVVATVLSLITAVWVFLHDLLDPAPRASTGAWLELLTLLVLFLGSLLSLRQEGIAERDGPGQVELVELRADGPPASA